MSYKHITINERCCIVEYLNLGWSLSKIAKELNRNKSSISREILLLSVAPNLPPEVPKQFLAG